MQQASQEELWWKIGKNVASSLEEQGGRVVLVAGIGRIGLTYSMCVVNGLTWEPAVSNSTAESRVPFWVVGKAQRARQTGVCGKRR
jgi:hypothetical protein